MRGPGHARIVRRGSRILLALVASSMAHAAIPQLERDALVALYNSTNASGWYDSSGWLGSPGTECGWRGVSCDTNSSTVLQIGLPGNNLIGPIPPEIGNLSSLTALGVDGNRLTSRPPEVGNLTSLASLVMDRIPSPFAPFGTSAFGVNVSAGTLGW